MDRRREDGSGVPAHPSRPRPTPGPTRRPRPGPRPVALDFDPYRFGLPDRPVPPEFAPPGYVAPTPAPLSDPAFGSAAPGGSTAGGSTYAAAPFGGGQAGYGLGEAPAEAGHNSGKSLWAMLCGIAAIVLCWLSYLDLVLIVPALVLGFAVIADERSVSRRQAWGGIICAAVGALGAIAFTVLYVHLSHVCPGMSGGNLQQCISNQF